MSFFVKTHSGAKIQIPEYYDNCITQLPGFFQNTLLSNRNSLLTQKLAGKVQLEGVKNIVFFLVDGFGLKQWKTYKPKHSALQRFEQDGWLGKLDSVFPSSTPVALNTLHTNGLMPAQHGLIDWWLYIEEIDKIVATLPFTPMGNEEMDSLLKAGVSPSILLRNPTTYEQFKQQGIKTKTFILKDYLQSVYTKTAYKGSELVPHKDINDLFTTLLAELAKPNNEPSYNFVYWSGIDSAGHKHGLDSDSYKQAVKEYFEGLDYFLVMANNIKNTLFVISADHGQVSVDPKETIYLDSIAGLHKLFKLGSQGSPILPWGGPREVFLAIKDGKQDEALSILQEAIGEHVELIESDKALKAGLFGQTVTKHPHLKSRTGNIIVLPKGKKTVWYHHPGEEPFGLKGHHGGLSYTELKVPFGLLRLN